MSYMKGALALLLGLPANLADSKMETPWECDLSATYSCTGTGCAQIRDRAFVYIWGAQNMYRRCDRYSKDSMTCSQFSADFFESRGVLFARLRGSAASARINADMSFVETAPTNKDAAVVFGTCKPGPAVIDVPSEPPH